MNAPMERDHLDASPSETVRRHAATFRRVRQARADALSDDVLGLTETLEPEVAQREALSDEVPTGARRLATVARGAGWTTVVAYSRSATGVDAVSVRARRPGELVVGYWRAGKFAWGLVARLSDGLRKVGARELKARLEAPKRDVPSDEDRPRVVPSDEKR